MAQRTTRATSPTTLPIEKLPRARRVQQARLAHQPVIVTESGQPVAALVNIADYNALVEELQCLRTLYAQALQKTLYR